MLQEISLEKSGSLKLSPKEVVHHCFNRGIEGPGSANSQCHNMLYFPEAEKRECCSVPIHIASDNIITMQFNAPISSDNSMT